MIEIEHLSKTYRSLFGSRTVHALNDFSLKVRPGEVIGIAGPNGAGKSTLISLLLGFITPTGGGARIGGLRPRAYVERHGVSYLPELVAIPPKWTVESTVRRGAALSGVPSDERHERTERIMQWLDLADQRGKRVHQLSKGNLQRLGLAQALIAEHDLVILDEPTYGLDPVWTQRFRDVVRELRNPRRMVLIASHNLDELERLADRVIILHRGRVERIVGPGGMSDVGTDAGTGASTVRYRLKLAGPHAALTTILPSAAPVDGRPNEWDVTGDIGTLNTALAQLIGAGAVVVSFAPAESRLETEFRMAMENTR